MKRCYKCDIVRPVSEFHKNSRRADGLQSYCVSCAAVKNREYYLRTPEKNGDRHASRERAIQSNMAFLLSYLASHPCVDCGEDDVVVLEFDHVRGTKLSNVPRLVWNGRPLHVVEDEITKCEVRCANCHRRATARRGNWKRLGLVAKR